jgi:pimeloyl-ACP methyl ester carboxylesterase
MSLTLTRPYFATVPLSTGVQLRYTEHGEPGTEPILCLHGYTDSSFSYSRIAPLLADMGYHVYALDQRGHGDSERPESGYAMDDFAADAVAFMDALGIARATFIGHSMGSYVARRAAELYPERIVRLVLIGSFAVHVSEDMKELRAAIQALGDPVPSEFAREFQASTVYAPVPEPFFAQVVAESGKLPAHVWRAALDGFLAADDTADRSRIAAPTLLLWGEQDAYIPREDQEQLQATIVDSWAIAYRETGHAPHWERPELIAEHLDAFMREA